MHPYNCLFYDLHYPFHQRDIGVYAAPETQGADLGGGHHLGEGSAALQPLGNIQIDVQPVNCKCMPRVTTGDIELDWLAHFEDDGVRLVVGLDVSRKHFDHPDSLRRLDGLLSGRNSSRCWP